MDPETLNFRTEPADDSFPSLCHTLMYDPPSTHTKYSQHRSCKQFFTIGKFQVCVGGPNTAFQMRRLAAKGENNSRIVRCSDAEKWLIEAG